MDAKTATILVISSATIAFLAYHVYETKEKLESKVNLFTKDFGKLRNENQQLNNENRKLEKRLEELISRHSETKSTAEKNSEKLRTENQNLEKRIEELKVYHSESKQIVETLKKNLENLKNENKKLEKRVSEKRPAFTAHFSSNPAQLTLSSNEILQFDVVVLNQGNGYDPLTGLFTAPRSGVYVVSSTVRCSKKSVHVILWKNGSGIVYAIANAPGDTGSLSVSLALKFGDRIFIRHDSAYAKGEVAQRGSLTMFSAVFVSD